VESLFRLESLTCRLFHPPPPVYGRAPASL